MYWSFCLLGWCISPSFELFSVHNQSIATDYCCCMRDGRGVSPFGFGVNPEGAPSTRSWFRSHITRLLPQVTTRYITLNFPAPQPWNYDSRLAFESFILVADVYVDPSDGLCAKQTSSTGGSYPSNSSFAIKSRLLRSKLSFEQRLQKLLPM